MPKPPRFKKGDRVRIFMPGVHSGMGTIEDGPKTARGKRYLVRLDDGRVHFAQFLYQQYLTPLDDGPKIAPAGK